MDTGLEDKGVLVTGGAGGIGSALCRTFAAEGARVGIHYLSSEERARRLAAETGGIPLKADLTDEAQVDRLVDDAVRELGRLDVLVANAGKWPSADEPVWEMGLDRWRATTASNLDSVFLSCRAFLRHVASTQTGNVVIVSSTAGLIGEAGHSDYAAAKSALAGGFLKSLKNEITRIAPRGRVNVVCPGWTETEMARDALAEPGFVDRITRTMALRKVGRAEDVARVVVALASDEISGHVTGEVVTVAGGMEGRVLHEEETAVGSARRPASGGMLDRRSVSSTLLASVGYEDESATLEVEFVEGGIYQYFGVPSQVHADLMAAGSHGSYFNAHIKNAGYQYSRVG